jgi:hypothetical protein
MDGKTDAKRAQGGGTGARYGEVDGVGGGYHKLAIDPKEVLSLGLMYRFFVLLSVSQ